MHLMLQPTSRRGAEIAGFTVVFWEMQQFYPLTFSNPQVHRTWIFVNTFLKSRIVAVKMKCYNLTLVYAFKTP